MKGATTDDGSVRAAPRTEQAALPAIHPAAAIDMVALFESSQASDKAHEPLVATASMHRVRIEPWGAIGETLLDTFPQHPGQACAFLRLPRGPARRVPLTFDGVDDLMPCEAGGWLLRTAGTPADGRGGYWMPQPPTLRRLDAHGRILWQQPLPKPDVRIGDGRAVLTVDVPADAHLDLVVWRFAPAAGGMVDALAAPLALERQRWFLRSSHAAIDSIGDVYRCLVHGWVYDDRFVRRPRFPERTWRICSENEAYSLYMLCNGLERATGRTLYTLLKRQIVGSIIARQAPGGGWHHGEWTDLMESHFRLHAAGVLVLEAAFEETRDPAVGRALEAAAAFLGRATDRTDVGTWFLHDALEQSVASATAEGAPVWEPTRCLGASPTNKLILNSHLDGIVTLDRYRELTGDTRHAATVDSALAAARTLLNARPAEWLYRPAYRALWLTLLPAERAARLAPPLKLVRRLAQAHLAPNLYRLKRRHPRFVMPGGLIDRHLSPRHYNTGYHTINLMDLVRLLRRFPDERLRAIVCGAVDAVTRTGLLQHWVETNRLQPVGYWVEAIYQLCTLDPEPEYRAQLAEAMLAAARMGIGLPPTLLGADPEVMPPARQVPCPSPADARLRVASLNCVGRREVVVVNTGDEAVALEWTSASPSAARWLPSGAHTVGSVPSAPTSIPSGGWVWGIVEHAANPNGPTSVEAHGFAASSDSCYAACPPPRGR